VLLSVFVIVDANIDADLYSIKTKRCDEITFSDCRDDHIDHIHCKSRAFHKTSAAVHRDHITVALNQHINQRTTNNIRLTAYKHILAIQIVTDGVENLHNTKWSTWLKFGCGIKAINIKFIWNTQGNTLVNQHGGVNQIREILEDEKLVETIVVVDNQMTPSARFADYVLPDTMNQEIDDMQGDAYAVGDYNYIVACPKAADILWEQKPNYWIMTEMAKRFGLEEKFTEGRTQKEWIRWGYEQTLAKAAKQPDPIKLPGFDEFWAKGFVKYHMGRDSGIVLKAFREDPEKHPLKTPSGRIEIYSERLAKIAETWELPKTKGQEIHPIPRFIATAEMLGQGDPLEQKYPLEVYGYHGAGRTHSTYHNVPWLRALHPDELMINPIDAEPRGIKTGDKVRVFNDRGSLVIPAFVTARVIPHLVAMPQGAWYRPDEKGVDQGACFNVLTTLEATPLAKGNPSHTNLVQVEKI